MKNMGIDALLTSSRLHNFYTTDFPDFDQQIVLTSEFYSLIPQDHSKEPYLITEHFSRYHFKDFPTWIERKLYFGNYYIIGGEDYAEHKVATAAQGIRRAVNELGLSNSLLGFEEDLLPVTRYKQISSALPGVKFVDASHLLRQLRMIKNEEEINRLRKAASITEKAIRATIEYAEPGMTENELRVMLEKMELEQGATAVFYTEISAGERGGYGATYYTDKRIEKHQVIRIDASSVYREYVSDICRIFTIGNATDRQRKYFDVSLKAEQAGISLIRSGIKASDIFRTCEQIPKQLLSKEYSRHHVGHGIGMEGHEAPILSPTNSTLLERNMVLCVEVPCYVWGLGGFAPEDTILVTEKSFEYLTEPETELIER
jgi:Xaa-Pro aminopeptidase